MDKKNVVQLVSFLNDRKLEVRLVAAEQVATISSNPEALPILKEAKVTRALCRHVGSDDPKLSRAVMSALINLSTNPDFLKEMIEFQVVSRVVDGILDSTNKVPELYAILLSNVTTIPEGASKLLLVGDPLFGYYVTKLFHLFTIVNDKDSFSWIAGIINNVTQIPEGRQFFLDKKRGLFKELLPFIEHPNILRRRGILGAVRNCIFESTSHEWLLSDDDLLISLLLPLRGSEVFPQEDLSGMPSRVAYPIPNKTRDSSQEVQSMCIDCLLLLTATKFGRETLRAKQVYPIIRVYESDSSEDVKANIYGLVNVLKGLDENPNIHVNVNPASLVQELSEEALPEETKPEEREKKKGKLKVKVVDTDEEGEAIEEL